MSIFSGISRRKFLSTALAAIAAGMVPTNLVAWEKIPPILSKVIPSTGEKIPAIGMGTWITFNVGKNQSARDERVRILDAFFKYGGAMIDSSPMYGSAEEVVGYCLGKLDYKAQLFSATKVWTPLSFYGKSQINSAHKLWGVEKFDLLQIHNLLSWESHLETLLQMKSEKKLRYVGITTSHGLRHGEMEKIMKTQPIDFIQLTYNVLDREPENRLLPLASEKKIAVIANRPYQRGDLFSQFSTKPLPNWATDIKCKSWAQFFLKFVISHPDVTCAIPATSQLAHMQENMDAGLGEMPDADIRRKMTEYIGSL